MGNEKVIIPKFMAEYIESSKLNEEDLYLVFYQNEDGYMPDGVDRWLYDNSNEENDRRFLMATRAWVEGYEVEQPKKYYWRKKKEYLAWFEKVEDSYINKERIVGRVTLNDKIQELSHQTQFTELEAKELLKESFYMFEKVEVN